jgi:membrane-bound serine protease (ClpP class)
MAPDTNVGSAHPVGLSPTGQTQPIDPVEEAKVTNDAVALIRGLATSRGRNADWVEQAVRQSVNVGVDQAVNQHVVDLKANDVSDLLRQLDGRTVKLAGGAVTLHTANAPADEYPMTILDQLGQALADPTLAYILMTLGVYALIYEVTHPGAIVPGVLGVVLLVIGLFALGTLSVSLAGMALVVFGFVLLAAEVVVVPGSGVLAIGGVGSLVLGSLLLMNDAPPESRVAPWAVAAVVLVSAGFFAILGRGVLAVRRRPASTGREGLLRAGGVALTDLSPAGQVLVHGEIWRADLAPGFASIAKGKPVFVVAVNGLTLTVAPAEVPAPRG